MAAKPEEKYDPGELTRTKINLGKISEDEAKRMSRILGVRSEQKKQDTP